MTTELKDTRLKDRIAIITGASSGIGRATALRYAASGARIVCADINKSSNNAQEAIDPVSEEINSKYGPETSIFVQVDVTNEESVISLIKETVSWAGRLDIICNYAGIASESAPDRTGKRLHETPVEDLDRTLAINVRGLWLCCKHAIAQFLSDGQEPVSANARGERTRGWIVNAASVYGLVGAPATPCYVTSKHAVVGLTKQLAVDYAKDRIHVNAVCPGFVNTPFIKNWTETEAGQKMVESLHPWGKIGTPEDVADAAVFLASDEA